MLFCSRFPGLRISLFAILWAGYDAACIAPNDRSRAGRPQPAKRGLAHRRAVERFLAREPRTTALA